MLVRMESPVRITWPTCPKHITKEMIVHPLEIRDIVTATNAMAAVVNIPDQYIDSELPTNGPVYNQLAKRLGNGTLLGARQVNPLELVHTLIAKQAQELVSKGINKMSLRGDKG